MKSRHAFFALLGSQLRYGLIIIVVGWSILLVAGITATLTLDSVRLLGKIWSVLTLMAGMGISVFLWSQDIRERRVLSWLRLPIRPAVAAGARLAVPTVLHALVILPFLFCLPIWFDETDSEASGALLRVFGIHAFSLLMSVIIYLSEELMVLVYKWGLVGVIGINVTFVVGMLGFVVLGDRLGLPELDSLPGMVIAYTGSVVLALFTVRLYARRANYLLGVDGCTSMPVDWGASS